MDFNGLDSFEVDDTVSGVEFIIHDVTLTERPQCPTCGPLGKPSSKGFYPDRMVVLDLPQGDVHRRLRVRRRRYECMACQSRNKFGGRGPEIHERWRMTKRLVAYIENAVTKHTFAHVARVTGADPDTIAKIATELADRLEKHHRFPTPRVLGIDGLTVNKIDYNVIGDALTGRPIGIVPSMRVDELRRWADAHEFDPNAVEIFVSDMHVTNVSFARQPLGHALHVADKFHILQGFQRPLSRLINIELNGLRAAGAKGKAKRLWDMKPGIMAVDKKRRKTRKKKGKPQLCLTFDDLKLVYADHPDVRRAVWARYDLAMCFKQASVHDALPWWDRFHRRVEPWKKEKEMKKFLAHLKAHKTEILNYFKAVGLTKNSRVRGPTTNAMESTNRRIKQIAEAANGTLSPEIFRMRVLYRDWKIGTDIVGCAEPGCLAMLGPLLGPWGKSSSHAASTGPRCHQHRL